MNTLITLLILALAITAFIILGNILWAILGFIFGALGLFLYYGSAVAGGWFAGRFMRGLPLFTIAGILVLCFFIFPLPDWLICAGLVAGFVAMREVVGICRFQASVPDHDTTCGQEVKR